LSNDIAHSKCCISMEGVKSAGDWTSNSFLKYIDLPSISNKIINNALRLV